MTTSHIAAGPYNPGDSRKVQTVFVDDTGVPGWPGSVTSTVRQPDGTLVGLTPANVTLVGDWTLEDGTVVTNPKAVEVQLPTFDAPGMWEWAQVGTVGITDADEGLIEVGYPGARSVT